jgi:hypothetical protein
VPHRRFLPVAAAAVPCLPGPPSDAMTWSLPAPFSPPGTAGIRIAGALLSF